MDIIRDGRPRPTCTSNRFVARGCRLFVVGIKHNVDLHFDTSPD